MLISVPCSWQGFKSIFNPASSENMWLPHAATSLADGAGPPSLSKEGGSVCDSASEGQRVGLIIRLRRRGDVVLKTMMTRCFQKTTRP